MAKLNRRDFLRFFPLIFGLGFASRISLPRPALAWEGVPEFASKDRHFVHGSNFRAIYGNEELRGKFLQFLQNVYSIYPDKEFHALILKSTQDNETDEDIYKAIQKDLPEITPFLSLLRYSLPSLSKQKDEMERQAAILLADKKTAVNYVEIGTPGRHVDGIENHVKITGDTYLLHTAQPSYAPGDIAERGHIMKVGTFVDMKNYDPVEADKIPRGKIELISNFIGFHHAPPDKRGAFVKSVSEMMPLGGRLILRDHDVDSEDMAHMVALAHDVFNAGLDVPWEINAAEIRNFTSVPEIEKQLSKYGLQRQGDLQLQEGDPTRNALMVFVKT